LRFLVPLQVARIAAVAVVVVHKRFTNSGAPPVTKTDSYLEAVLAQN
jgi:hypothetical protein